MDPAKRILASLISSTQCIQTLITQYTNAKDARQVQGLSLIRLEMELHTIADWLSDTEPEMCLATLNEMQGLLKVDHRVQSFKPTEFSYPEDDVIVAIMTLFRSRKAHFHFLLTINIWNNETGAPKETSAMNVNSNNTACEVTQNPRQHPSIATSYIMSKDENQRKREVISQKLDKFLHFLDGLDCTVKQKETSSLRQPDTCTWLCSTGAYRSWRDGSDLFLLLQGKAGAGKTVLASTVIEDLLETKREDEFLVYFYCDFRTKRSTSSVEVMRSILAQLVTHSCAVVVDPENLLNDLLKETNSHVDLFYSAKGLSRYLSKVARLCPRKPLVVIDALDECREVGTLVDGLIMTSHDVQTFATSRPIQSIITMLSCFPSISMDSMANELSADISLHVTKELDSRCRLRAVEESFKAKIRSKLCAKADGMFRWVQCQIDMLDKCASISEIQRVLESLPEGLEETYRRILIAIDKRSYDACRTRRALVWLVTALRPMRMDELIEAIMIDPDYRALDSRFRLMKGADLLEVCRSLVVYRQETNIITLSHMSVKDYLVGELVRIKLPRYHIVMEDAHERLAKLCITYIVICLEQMKEARDRSPCAAQNRGLMLTVFHGTRPLLKYVLSYGFNHLSHFGSSNIAIFKDIKNLQLTILQCTAEWDRMCGLVPSVRTGVPWPTSQHDFTLYTLIAFASSALFHSYIRHFDITPRPGTNPLIYAAYLGKTEHARILVSHGADMNLAGLIVNTTVADSSGTDAVNIDKDDSNSVISDAGSISGHKSVPLEVAADHWHGEIVDLLLAKGCLVPDRLLARVLAEQPHNFPLYVINHLLQTTEFAKWSITPWKNRRLLESLVDDAEDQGEVDGGEELALALRRLVQAGCAETLLLLAVEKGCVWIVKALLSMNTTSASDLSSASDDHAMVNALAPNGDTLLHTGMRLSDENQCLTITKLLVEAGCNTRERDADNKPPLHIAVERGFISVVDYLLSQDVPLPSRILFATLQVTPPKRAEMIRFLVRKGANIRVLSPNGHPLLHVAMHSPDKSVFPEIAQILIDAGWKPSPLSLCGETPICIATEQDYCEVAIYLLLFSASLDILFLLNPDPSTQAAALHSLICNVHGLRFRPEEEHIQEKKLLQVVTRYLDDEGRHLALAKMLLTVQGELCSAASTNMLCNAVRRGFYPVVEYLVAQRVPLPCMILFTALQNQVSMIPFLVRRGADVNVRDDDGKTLLHVAMSISEETQRDMAVQVVIQAGCPISAPSVAGVRPLDNAAIDDFTSVVKYILLLSPRATVLSELFSSVSKSAYPIPSRIIRHFVDHVGVAFIDPAGNGLLHYVIMLSSVEEECQKVTRSLIQTGCYPFAQNALQETPLHAAIMRNFGSVAGYLISLGVPLSSNILFVVLEMQALYPPLDIGKWRSIVCLAIEKGADVHARNTNGDTMIHHALRLGQEQYCLVSIKLMIEAGCCTSVPNADGELPIEIAVTRGLFTILEYLLSQNTPLPRDVLLTATQTRHFIRNVPRMIRFLVQNGADVSVCTTNGDSVLHLLLSRRIYSFVSDSLLDAVKILVGQGCDPGARNSEGRTPLEIAVAMEHPRTITDYLRAFVPEQ